MSKDPELYGTGRILSPIKSPDGNAIVVYQDDDVTIWLYPQSNAVRIQTLVHKPEQIAVVKRKAKKALEAAIRNSQARIEQAQKAIASNQRDINGYSSALLELETMWPEEGSFDG